MKYRTKLFALSGTAAGLALLIALGLVFSPENMQKRAMKGDILSAKAKDKVASVKIDADGVSLTLRKTESGWLMEKSGLGFPASMEKVDSLLTALSSVKEMYRISTKKNALAKLGLEPPTKKIVLLDAAGKSLVGIILGNSEANGKKIYLAYEGKDASYSIKNELEGYLRTDDRSWADLKAVRQDFKEGEIQELSVDGSLPASDGQEAVQAKYHLVRDAKKGWVVDGNPSFVLDQGKVGQLLRGVSGLEGDSFVTDKADEAKKLLADPAATLSFRSGKGTEYRILISGADSEKRHAVKEQGSDIMVYVNAWNVRSSLKPLDLLRLVEPVKKK